MFSLKSTLQLLIFLFPLIFADIRIYIAKVERADFFITDNAVFNVNKQSLTQCMKHCILNLDCTSILYKTSSTECHGIGVGYLVLPGTVGLSSFGWNYYLIRDSRCPESPDYVFSNRFNSCYKLHELNTSLQIVNYNDVCVTEGGELMKIDSEEKQQHIMSFVDQFQLSSWIVFQGKHLIIETPWKYNDGSIISYFNWASNQPDATTSFSTEYLAMKKTYNYKWHDVWPNFQGAFLCEKILA